MLNTPEQIDFNCFFMATKHILNDLIVGCNPYTQKYFKVGSVYVALSHNPDINNVHIEMMAGKLSLESFNQIRIMARKVNAKTMTWCTSENNKKVLGLSKYYKAYILTEIPNFYPDGSTGKIFQMDLD